MSLYDMLELEMECPKCGHRWQEHCQTKGLEREMKTYCVGDEVPAHCDGELFAYGYCKKCKKTVFQAVVVKDGVIARQGRAVHRDDLPEHVSGWVPSAIASWLGNLRREDLRGDASSEDYSVGGKEWLKAQIKISSEDS